MSFDAAMYERIRQGCIDSADVVAPWVYDRVRPQSVIDVGGGEGWWARAFVDTHWKSRGPRAAQQPFEPMRAWVLDESLVSRREQHIVGDPLAGTIDFMQKSLTVPLDPGDEQFDLAICLEVAEHLDEAHGPQLIESLCNLAPVVLFSAAIPGQGGHGHVNEQWASYWASLFLDHGYLTSTSLRDAMWDQEAIEPWYRQNLLIAGEAATLTSMGLAASTAPLDVVHPVIFGWRLQERAELQERIDEWQADALESRDR